MRRGGAGGTVASEDPPRGPAAGAPAPGSRRPLLVLAAKIALVGIAYYVSARLGLKLALIQRNVTPLWPPTGIALVALLVLGRRVWPGILVAALLVNLPISANALAAGATAVGNTAAPLLAVWLLSLVGFRWQLDRQRDALAIVFLGGLSMLVSASVGTAVLVLSGEISSGQFLPAWAVWWTGDAMGVLVVAPFLLSLGQFRTSSRWTWSQWAEVATLVALVAAASIVITNTHLRLLFLIVPLLGWTAWRCQLLGAAPAALLVVGSAAGPGGAGAGGGRAGSPGRGPDRRADLGQRAADPGDRRAGVGGGAAPPAGTAAGRGPAGRPRRELGVAGPRQHGVLVRRDVPHPRASPPVLPGDVRAGHGPGGGGGRRQDPGECRSRPAGREAGRPARQRVPDRSARRRRAGPAREVEGLPRALRRAGPDGGNGPGRDREQARRGRAPHRGDAAAQPAPGAPSRHPGRGAGGPLRPGRRGDADRRGLVRRRPAPHRKRRPGHRRRGRPRAASRVRHGAAADGPPGLRDGGGVSRRGGGPGRPAGAPAGAHPHGHSRLPGVRPRLRVGPLRERRAPAAAGDLRVG